MRLKLKIILLAMLLIVGFSSSAYSQVTFGGYNPLKIHDGTVQLLVKNNLMGVDEANKIVKELKESKKPGGVYISGINTLQAFEKLANALIAKYPGLSLGINSAMQKAKQSGGIKIGGYNVVVLYAGLLDTLINAGMISLDEGQKVLNKAKK